MADNFSLFATHPPAVDAYLAPATAFVFAERESPSGLKTKALPHLTEVEKVVEKDIALTPDEMEQVLEGLNKLREFIWNRLQLVKSVPPASKKVARQRGEGGSSPSARSSGTTAGPRATRTRSPRQEESRVARMTGAGELASGTGAAILEELLRVNQSILEEVQSIRVTMKRGQEQAADLAEDASKEEERDGDEKKEGWLSKMFGKRDKGEKYAMKGGGMFDDILKMMGMPALIAAFEVLGPLVAAVGVGIAAWKFGAWIAKITGLGDSVKALCDLLDTDAESLHDSFAAMGKGMTEWLKKHGLLPGNTETQDAILAEQRQAWQNDPALRERYGQTAANIPIDKARASNKKRGGAAQNAANRAMQEAEDKAAAAEGRRAKTWYQGKWIEGEGGADLTGVTIAGLPAREGWGDETTPTPEESPSPVRTPTSEAAPAGPSSSPDRISMSNLLDTIASGEAGSYDTTLDNGKWRGAGDEQKKPITEMTLLEIWNLQQSMIRKGARSGAVGRYQFVPGTLFGPGGPTNPAPWSMMAKAGLLPSDKFSAETQNMLAAVMLQNKGLARFQSGAMSAEEFGIAISQGWSSVADPRTGRSYYDEKGRPANAKRLGAKATTTAAQVQAVISPFRTAGNVLASAGGAGAGGGGVVINNTTVVQGGGADGGSILTVPITPDSNHVRGVGGPS
jgi:hypothetical protein